MRSKGQGPDHGVPWHEDEQGHDENGRLLHRPLARYWERRLNFDFSDGTYPSNAGMRNILIMDRKSF